MNRSQKEAKIIEIQEKFKASNASIITNYKGLTVEKITGLRKELRAAGADYKVFKNTMSTIAYKELGFSDMGKYFTDSTAIAFTKKDPAKMAKILADFKKENELFGIKAGTLGDKFISENDVKVLASLPSKEILLGKLLGNMKGPISGLVSVLNGNLSKLVYTLKAIADSKEKAAA